MSSNDLEDVVAECHQALAAIITGDAEPWSAVLSHADDVTLGNPFGPFVRGFQQVMATAKGAAERYRDGVVSGFDRIATHVSPELACVVCQNYVEYAGGKRAAAAAADDARALGSATHLARAAIVYTEMNSLGTPDPMAPSLLEEARTALGDDGSLPERAGVLAMLAFYRAWTKSEGVNAAGVAAEALELARRSGDPSALSTALYASVYATYGSPDPGSRLALVEELIEFDAPVFGGWMEDSLAVGQMEQHDVAAAALDKGADR